jgi:hypothetical protein
MADIKRNRIGKFLLKFVLIVVILMMILILIASPLSRYLVEKNDVKYTGREIEVGRVFLNPLTGNVKLKNLKIYELNSDTVFFSVRTFKADLSIVKLLTGTYQVNSLLIERPEIIISRTDTVFNFSDLLEKFAIEADTTKELLHLNILNIKVRQGRVHYKETENPVDLTISKINFSSSGKYWDRDSIDGEFSLVPDTGKMSGNFKVNTENRNYQFNMNLNNFDLASIQGLLSGIIKKASLSAIVDMDLRAKGNFGDPKDIDATGTLDINDFHLGNGKGDDITSIRRVLVDFRQLNPKKGVYHFGQILIDSLSANYVRYDSLDNIKILMGSNAEKNDTIQKIDSANILLKILDSDYHIDNFSVKGANFRFTDYSNPEKFSLALNPLSITADSIDKSNSRLNIKIESKIEPHGLFTASIRMDPKNEKNIDGKYELSNMPAPMFNPYLLTFTSYQLDKGRIEIHGNWTIRNERIRILNHFIVIDPKNTKKSIRKDTRKVPLPLILAFIREKGSLIDYEIPITGNLNDPKFHLKDVLSDLLRNIFVKPPTTPYRLQVKNVEEEIEKTLTVVWKMRQVSLPKEQEKFLGKIADFLKDNKEANLVVHQIYHEAKEKENILFFEAKKKYFLEKKGKNENTLSKDDSIKVEKMPTKDSALLKYLDKTLKKPLPHTVQEKYYQYVGREVVSRKFELLAEKRREAFMKFFRDNGTDNRIDFLRIENQVPYNWFSYFKIDYKGDIPESLKEAFNKLYEINSEPPREDYSGLFKRR